MKIALVVALVLVLEEKPSTTTRTRSQFHLPAPPRSGMKDSQNNDPDWDTTDLSLTVASSSFRRKPESSKSVDLYPH